MIFFESLNCNKKKNAKQTVSLQINLETNLSLKVFDISINFAPGTRVPTLFLKSL